MSATADVVSYPSFLSPTDGTGKRERPRRSNTGHRPLLAPWQVGRATGFMLGRLAEPLHVPELASMCRLSPPYFARAFANTVGVAPYAWFLARRIARAQFLLTNSELPLAQIALDCGFTDQAHFTNAFGKATGTTPARWRKEQPERPERPSDSRQSV